MSDEDVPAVRLSDYLKADDEAETPEVMRWGRRLEPAIADAYRALTRERSEVGGE